MQRNATYLCSPDHNPSPLQGVVSRGGQRVGLRGADAAAGPPPLLRDRAVRHHGPGGRRVDPAHRGTSIQHRAEYGAPFIHTYIHTYIHDKIVSYYVATYTIHTYILPSQ